MTIWIYKVRDCRTGEVTGRYKTRRRAVAAAERRNQEYGAVRFIVIAAMEHVKCAP